jgi:hypothetical protein
MRAYRRFMSFGVLALIGLGATLIVQGGWQAVAAGFAIFNGGGFALTFVALGMAGERPRSRRPSWAREADPHRQTVTPKPVARRGPAPAPGVSLAPRPARTV